MSFRVPVIILFLISGVFPANGVHADAFEDAVEVVNRRDFETAYKMLAPLAEKGHAAAQLVLGMMYFKGAGIEKNIIKADKWLLISEELGQEAGKKNRVFVERQMSREQVSLARQLAGKWLKKR